MIRLTTVVTALMLGAATATVAGEALDHGHRHHPAHEHGVARLNLAVEGREVHLELMSPAANLVGFEHVPRDAGETAAVAAALAALRDGARMFRFPPAAGCALVDAKAQSPLAMTGDHGHGMGKSEQHAEVHASYRYRCRHPRRLGHLRLTLFAIFPATTRVEVQYVTATGQGADRLTAADPELRL